MTPTTNDEDPSEDKKKRRTDRDREEVIPVPADRPFFEWLEKLFYQEPEAEHYPQKITIHTVAGRHFERNISEVTTKTFATTNVSEEARKKTPGLQRKPTREQLIQLANEFTYRMKETASEMRKSTVFAIEAWHFSTADGPYERLVKRYEPKSRSNGANGSNGEGEDDEESAEKRAAVQMMSQMREFTELHVNGLAGVISVMERDLNRKDTRIEALEAKLWAYFERAEKFFSMEEEREDRREARKIKREVSERALFYADRFLPKLLGAQVPLAPSEETKLLVDFFQRLTKEQEASILGVNEEGHIVAKGVFTPEQVVLLAAVAKGQAPTTELDKLMPGKELEVRGEQVVQLQSILTYEQLSPLMNWFQARASKK